MACDGAILTYEEGDLSKSNTKGINNPHTELEKQQSSAQTMTKETLCLKMV